MRVYHRTWIESAIRTEGFCDTNGGYGKARSRNGVWVSDSPPDATGDDFGETVLSLDVPDDVLVKYEWVKDAKGYRKFLVPASILNRCGRPKRE